MKPDPEVEQLFLAIGMPVPQFICEYCGGMFMEESPLHTCVKIPFTQALRNLTRWLGSEDRALELLADDPKYHFEMILHTHNIPQPAKRDLVAAPPPQAQKSSEY